MKEIDEAMQMRIFDLLEGNLGDGDKAKLLTEIAASPVLQREYDLMAKTYLQNDEPIVFAKKSSLYHKPGFVISFNPLMRYAAASVVLLACGIAGWYYMGSRNAAVATVVAGKEIAPSQNNKVDASNNPTLEIAKSDNLKPVNKKTIPGAMVKDSASNVKKQEEVFVEALLPEIVEEKVAVNDAVEIAPPNQVFDTAIANAAQNAPIPIARKRSLSYKLINGGRAMLANLDLPEIKFSTEKNKNKVIPTVKMTISTMHTDVIATLID